MSEETNRQIIQSAYEKFGSGDIPGLLSLLDENILWEVPAIENALSRANVKDRKPPANSFRN